MEKRVQLLFVCSRIKTGCGKDRPELRPERSFYFMENASNSFMVTEKTGTLMKKFALPCIISLLVGALYNIVDQIYIGWGVGYLGNGATNVVFPLTVAALAVAVMIGDGACSFISLCLGRKDPDNASHAVGNAVLLSVFCGILIMVLYLSFRDPILWLFGATDKNISYARDYFTWISAGIPFYVFGQAMNPIIRSDGSPRYAMYSTLAGAILNVFLDPVAIFLLHWGVMGAAVATVVGQIVTAVMAVLYLLHMKAVRLNRKSFRFSAAITGRYLPLGFCSFLSQISMVVAMAATNNMLVIYGAKSIYGADIPLTVLGIVMKIFQIIISIVVGMAAGCIPIVGFNYGAQRFDRAREIMRKLLTAEAILGLISLALVEIFPRQLIGIFGSENELYNSFAVMTFRIYLSMITLACVNKATFIFMQSLGKSLESTLLSLFREIVLGVSLVILLPKFMGLNGVLYSMPVADILTFAASAVIILKTNRELKEKESVPQEVQVSEA